MGRITKGYILFRELGEAIDYLKLMNYTVGYSDIFVSISGENKDRYCVNLEGGKYLLEGGDWFNQILISEENMEEFKKKLVELL